MANELDELNPEILKEGLETYGVEICSYAELEKQDVEFMDAFSESHFPFAEQDSLFQVL